MTKKNHTKKFWTDDEREMMEKRFPNEYTEVLSKEMGRTYRSVAQQAIKQGLKKSPEFLKMELLKQAERLKVVGASFRYQKGREPENKGKPMPVHVYEKVKRTMFKKGSIPKNAIAENIELLRKDSSGNFYWLVKVPGNRRLVPKHIHLWETNNGKIHKGFNVVFKDGNTQNCTIENLECISNEELMYRNSKQNYPVEIIPTLLTINKLKKKIHEKQNGGSK